MGVIYFSVTADLLTSKPEMVCCLILCFKTINGSEFSSMRIRPVLQLFWILNIIKRH